MEPRATLVPRASQRVVPWKNGGGSTREVAVSPPGATLAGGFRWRVSVATVAEAGPFSAFPGVERTLYLLRGTGMALDLDGRAVSLERPYQRVDFPGELAVSARLLGGPTEDLNVMLARGVTAEQELLRLGPGVGWQGERAAAGDDLLLILEGTLSAVATPDRPWLLGEGDALRRDGGQAGRGWALQAGPNGAVALLLSVAG